MTIDSYKYNLLFYEEIFTPDVHVKEKEMGHIEFTGESENNNKHIRRHPKL